jgi:hypothetical protein
MLHGKKLQKPFRTDARPAAEQFGHMKITEPKVSRQRCQVRLLRMMSAQKDYRLPDTRVIGA